ncbi:MAG: hypothetical protein WKG07_09000 [Hymenobacter sp.]
MRSTSISLSLPDRPAAGCSTELSLIPFSLPVAMSLLSSAQWRTASLSVFMAVGATSRQLKGTPVKRHMIF